MSNYFRLATFSAAQSTSPPRDLFPPPLSTPLPSRSPTNSGTFSGPSLPHSNTIPSMGTVSPTSEPDRKRVRFSGSPPPPPSEPDKPDKLTLQATKVVQLRFLRDSSDLHPQAAATPHPDHLTTHPTYLHQVFPKGLIHGWRSLTVAVYVHLPTLTYWIDSHGQLADTSDKDAVEVTDVPGMLAPFIKAGLVQTRAEFEQHMDAAVAPILDTRQGTYQSQGKAYATYVQPFFRSTPHGTLEKDNAFHEFHRRMSFLMFVHIDGASFIDDDDPRWRVFVVMEEVDGNPSAFVGYATVYLFSALAKTKGTGMQFSHRIRVSQVVISPLEQGKGHGGSLLRSIYAYAKTENAIEVTVEDPSIGFRLLRDVVDLKRAYAAAILNEAPLVLEEEEAIIERLRKDLMLTAGQAKRCLEVHQLRYVDRDNEDEYKKYRLWVKRRLFKDDYEILHNFDKEERKNKLQELYEDYEKEYIQAITRLQHKK